MTKEIPLTQGKVALIDDVDFELVSRHKWHAEKRKRSFYAATTIDGKSVYLHRFIMQTTNELEIDHRDRDGLNCTRHNMRLATPIQNGANRGIGKDNTSGYKGVYFQKSRNKWVARIGIGGSKFLGSFNDPIEAARAYDAAARELYGEFASLNFP